MSKKSVLKATFDDLIKRKIQKEKDQQRTKDIYVSSMDRTLTFKTPKDETVLDILDEMGDMKLTSSVIRGYKKLIYLCCDMLQDTNLQEEIGVQDPFDTVDVLFSLSDVTEIGEQLMELIDVGGKDEEIKNS